MRTFKRQAAWQRPWSETVRWDQSLTDLLDLLVRYYSDPISARDVAVKAGLNTRFINFSGNTDSVWMSTLREASKFDEGLLKIAGVAQRDYPDADFLTIVRQIDEGAVRGPRLAEPSWKGPPTVDEGLEKVMGEQPTFLPISFLEVGLEKARSVARVVSAGGLGTGFLTRDNLLITNHHVISSVNEAKHAKIQFNYQETPTGLATQIAEFLLTPDDGFATSPMEGGDDWTAVRVKGDPGKDWGFLPLAAADVNTNDYVNIIQHPRGLTKQIALYHNLVVFVGADRVQYLTDTLPGSSGSPVFDSQWRVVALHHSGGKLTEPGSKRKRLYFRNEGIHVTAIVKGLAELGL
jgi:V8-like Glu-specific endopeptidase